MTFKPLFEYLTGQHLNCHFGGKPKDPAALPAAIKQSALDVSIAGRKRKRDLGRRSGLASTVLAGGNPGLTTGKQKLSGESN